MDRSKFLVQLLIWLVVIMLWSYPFFFKENLFERLDDLENKIHLVSASNEQLGQEIRIKKAEYKELESGLFLVERNARYELNLIKPNEIFIDIPHP